MNRLDTLPKMAGGCTAADEVADRPCTAAEVSTPPSEADCGCVDSAPNARASVDEAYVLDLDDGADRLPGPVASSTYGAALRSDAWRGDQPALAWDDALDTNSQAALLADALLLRQALSSKKCTLHAYL